MTLLAAETTGGAEAAGGAGAKKQYNSKQQDQAQEGKQVLWGRVGWDRVQEQKRTPVQL